MANETKDIDPEALKLLEDNGWRWQGIVGDGFAGGFVRKARAGEKHDVITFGELDANHLVIHREFVTLEHDRQKGLDWLRKRIAQPNPRA